MSPSKNNPCNLSMMNNIDIADTRQKVSDAVTRQLLFDICVRVDVHAVHWSRGSFSVVYTTRLQI